MRLMVVRGALIGLAATLSGCVEVYDPTAVGPAQYPPAPFGVELARVDPQDAAERAVIGSVLGSALGTGIGAVFAINPAIGAVVGAESGAAIGAAVGAATAQPLPSYAPIAAPNAALIPDFYDTWVSAAAGYLPDPAAAPRLSRTQSGPAALSPIRPRR
jgi:hypothetical protein